MRDVETDRMQDAGGAPATSADAQSVVAPPSPDTARTQSRPKAASSNPVDTLTSSLDALSLVPSTIRFGRGARRGAHGHGHGHAPGRGRGRGRGLGDERGGGAPGRPVDGPAAGEERTERRALGDGVLKRGRGLGGARARARAM
ncbi:hypothetical protein OBBRIDRAFT_321549 [Obba rivulosa]|uniref:Uncharacterized protein n=1 Tax=Obba rivulosa TaxID=1052685 RepID=A0A8E2DEX3_9APHY|nr:hypothetical protein OBBRIDRAFT_321549 [Obba rivulosa]